MPRKSDKSKAGPSALAQVVGLLEQHENITKTSELVERTGFTDRAIRRAKAERLCLGTVMPTRNGYAATRNGCAADPAQVFLGQKEKSPPHPPLKKNLAAAAASDLLIWLKENFSITEPEASEWLSEQIERYGEGKVRSGWADYKRKLHSDQVQTHSIATLRGFISSATPTAEALSGETEQQRMIRETLANFDELYAEQQRRQADA